MCNPPTSWRRACETTAAIPEASCQPSSQAKQPSQAASQPSQPGKPDSQLGRVQASLLASLQDPRTILLGQRTLALKAGDRPATGPRRRATGGRQGGEGCSSIWLLLAAPCWSWQLPGCFWQLADAPGNSLGATSTILPAPGKSLLLLAALCGIWRS